MYYDRCKRIHDFRKPTIAAVQGSCVAAGLMLACMCDLIVAADDAKFSNPVLRMTGAGVELLVEPWELGIRKAKEFLLDRRRSSTPTRPGGSAWSTGSSPATELADAHQGAGRAHRPGPPGHRPGGQGLAQPHRPTSWASRDSWKYHFMAHHWMHNTATARTASRSANSKTR